MSMSPFSCPQCGKPLLLEDFNVSENMAFCRACGYTGAFLGNTAVRVITDEEMAHPPKRVRLRKGFDDELQVICTPKRWVLWFLVPFTLLWSGISMTVIFIVPLATGKFEWKEGLFGLPFLVGTIFLLGFILMMVFGHLAVTLSRGQVRIFRGAFGLGRTQTIPCGGDTSVSIEQSSVSVNNVRQSEIVLRNGEKTVQFGATSLSKEAMEYVAAVLRRAGCGG